MKTHIILLILFACSVLSFQNDKLPQKNTIYPQIIGTWKMVNRYSGWEGRIPIDPANKHTITFKEDGSYTRVMGDNKDKGAYVIIYFGRSNSYILRYYKDNNLSYNGVDKWVAVKNDTLHLDTEVGEDLEYTFVRQ